MSSTDSPSLSQQSPEGHTLGCVPSPIDVRDFIFENTAHATQSREQLPEELDLTSHLRIPRDQGSRGTCCAFACGAIKEYHERLDANYRGYFSPDSVYYYRTNKPQAGMYLRDAMKILTNRGMCREEILKYDPSAEAGNLTQDVIDDATDYKIKSYARINSIQGLKESLYQNGPALIAFPVYDASPEFWRSTKPDTQLRGGHAVAVIGYTKDAFILRNSWGDDWNTNGTVLYPFTEWGTHWEVWTAVDADTPHWFPDPNPHPDLGEMTTNCFTWLKRKIRRSKSSSQ